MAPHHAPALAIKDSGRAGKANGRKVTEKARTTRLAILNAAANAFAERGYQQATLADIATSAGLHLTALYYYYENKEALAGDLLIMVSRRNSEALHAALAVQPRSASFRQRIKQAVPAYLGAILNQDQAMRAYRAIVSEVSPAVREQALMIHRQDGDTWRALVEGAVEAGAIHADVDAAMLCMALLGAMNWSVEWFDPTRGSPARFSASLDKLLFDRTDGS